MTPLEIKRISQEDRSETVELQIGGITKASFSITTEMTIDEVRNQFERALNGLPKEIIITVDTVKELLKLLLPGFFQSITLAPPSLSDIENHLRGVVQKLEQYFGEAMKEVYSGVRIEQYLVNNKNYNFSQKYFTFVDFLNGRGILATLYHGNYSKGDALKMLKKGSYTVNIGNKTLEEIINILIIAGFPISE